MVPKLRGIQHGRDSGGSPVLPQGVKAGELSEDGTEEHDAVHAGLMVDRHLEAEDGPVASANQIRPGTPKVVHHLNHLPP